MRIYKKVLTPRGIFVGEPVWTDDGKPGLRIKQARTNFYDTISLEDINRQIFEALGIENGRV